MMNTFAVLGTGPSMSQELADYVRDKCSVIAVSDAYKLAPWATALVSNDRAWWQQHPEAMNFAGRKFAACKVSGTEYLMPNGVYRAGSNSGLQGLRVAEMLGATRILLLGFDMRGTHYFGEHVAPLRNTTPKRFAAHIAQFKGWYGPKVINCTPGSAIKVFPMMNIRDALSGERPPPRFELCTPLHAHLYQQYYVRHPVPAKASLWLQRVELLAKRFDATDIIDYGSGPGGGLSRFATLPVRDYDPGVQELAHIPEPADLVVSIHTLEHVEPECVNAVIEHMVSLARKAVFVVVSCEPSTKKLSDGSPWHCFVRSADWWSRRLTPQFEAQPVLKDRLGAEYAALHVVLSPP